MATNKYFNQYTYGREQRLTEDLLVEAIAIHGLTAKYLPRTIWNEDILMGEDPLSRFNTAIDVEVWVKSNTSFEGQGDILSKFNIELRDQVVLVMAQRRWSQLTQEHLLAEVGDYYQTEEANTGQHIGASYLNAAAPAFNFLLETASANGYNFSSQIRPNEGDLLYFAQGKDLFEIKFVEHENPFFPHGKRMLYELTCEKFRYSSEEILTGNTEIDEQMAALSLDVRDYDYLLEDGFFLLDEETSDHLITEYRIEDTAKVANNEYFHVQTGTGGVIDFSERNPFAGAV